ncbi:MAG: SGNH/GDSL hydrolase family protein [Clostridiales bacterium]|nr:SGNH/GDSL hydrolase family protein [Clostridiales bacterium]
MKKGKKIILFAAAFIVTLILLWLLTLLFMPKYRRGIVEGAMIAEYYEDRKPHEVIFIGDCEVYENISTVELYREYGISSYIRGSAQQLIWQSYYLLEDTLRYETPKVVFFNVLSLKYNEPQNEAYNRMTLDGMRWSSSKWNAVQASMTPDEDMVDYLFPLLRYHSRWNELTSDDIRYMFGGGENVTIDGYYMRCDVKPQAGFPKAPVLADYRLGENAMNYLSMMADLCEEHGVTLILMKAPTEYPYWYDEWDRQVREFAQERGLEYFNYVDLRDEAGIDMSTDTYDSGLHLNVFGAEKLADYIGAYLSAGFDLTDYRNDPAVSSMWEEDCEAYDLLMQRQLSEIEEYGELVSFGANAI